MPDATGETRLEDAGVPDGNLAFVAFTLSHSPCEEDVIELRLGEGLLLQWCLACADMNTYVSPGG